MAYTSSLKTANQLLKAGRLDDACQEYQKLIDQKPNFAWNYYYLGQVFVQQQKWSDAVAQYQQAIKLNPNSANLYNSLAEALIKQGELDRAINSSKKAISLEPNLAIYYQTLALVYEAKSDFAQELTTWQKVLSLNPNHFKATQKISWLQTDIAKNFVDNGDKLNKEGKIKEAVEFYQQALFLNPQQPMSIYRNCGNNLITLSRFKEAEVVFQQLIEKYPNQPHGYEGYAKVSHSLGNWELALIRWSEAAIKFPQYISFQHQKGSALINLSRFKEAEAFFQQLIEKYPNQHHGYEGYAKVSHHLADWELALKRWSDGIAKFPEYIWFQIGKGNALINLSRFKEAEGVFQQLIEKYPNQHHGYEGYARVAQSLPDWELALQRWENALEKFPNYFNFYLPKGDALAILSRYEEAETWWKKVIAKYPHRHEGLSKSATLARHLGNRKFAWQRFEQIMEKFPGHIPAYCEAAKELMAMGRFVEAEAKYREALQRNPNNLTVLLQGGILASQQGNRELALERFERASESYDPQKAIDAYILAATELKYLGRETEAEAKYEQILSFHQQRGLYPEVKLLGTGLTSIQELGLLLDRLVTKQPNSAKDVVSLAQLTDNILLYRRNYPAPVAKDASSLLPKLKILKELFSQVIATQEDCKEQDLLVLKHFNMAIQLLEKESQRLNSSEWRKVKLLRTEIPLSLINELRFEGLSSSARYVIGADEWMPKFQTEATVKYLPGLMDEEKEYFPAKVGKLASWLKLRSRQTIEIFKDFICEPPYGISEGYILPWFYYCSLVSQEFIHELDSEKAENSEQNIIYSKACSKDSMKVFDSRGFFEEIAISQKKLDSYYEDEVVFGIPNVWGIWGAYQNYGHLLFDQIPSLILYQKLNLSCKIFVPHIMDSHWEIFNALNIPRERILVKQEQKFKYFIISCYQHNAEIIDIYRKLRESIVAKRSDIPSEYRARYVYISRKHSTNRAMTNEAEVEELMASLGFSIVYAERLSFEEKAMLMNYASFVVSPHGAGILNSVMCHPNTTIVVIMPPGTSPCTYNYRMCAWSEYSLYLLLGKKTANGWETNINKLKKVITTILEAE
ncbi:tetratricopeptide repeat protein [Okeania sp.]|uniref:tetratricopeptide repeat protein n=1 Tax=Okeania sp. TaxID=3100323 RepID=UPI002B4AE92E|nr:tetratricopeptide repeat protein [Okeania sp.]MEB3340127.1 tetratricopeptide repeat protein [Okeania sp.]